MRVTTLSQLLSQNVFLSLVDIWSFFLLMVVNILVLDNDWNSFIQWDVLKIDNGQISRSMNRPFSWLRDRSLWRVEVLLSKLTNNNTFFGNGRKIRILWDSAGAQQAFWIANAVATSKWSRFSSMTDPIQFRCHKAKFLAYKFYLKQSFF